MPSQCPICYAPLDSTSKYCPQCGVHVKAEIHEPIIKIKSDTGSFVDCYLADKDGKELPISPYVTQIDVRIALDELVTAKIELEMMGLDMVIDHVRLTPDQIEIFQKWIDKSRV